MGSLLFVDEGIAAEGGTPAFSAEGRHEPDGLAHKSGLWIGSAGTAMLSAGSYPMRAQEAWLWLCSQGGSVEVKKKALHLRISRGECSMIPPLAEGLVLRTQGEARVLWFTVAGPLGDLYMHKLGAFPSGPVSQTALPAQLKLARGIVHAAVRFSQSAEASSSQLQQLLWALLASHSGQPVAMDAVLSHQIARVVDAMRRKQYRENYSLADMAGLSRMPTETFRKRFASEVGMPPQKYQLLRKMERAKTLLRDGHSVQSAGSEVGLRDPYHFSKTFKKYVGLSPSVYSRLIRQEEKATCDDP